MVLGYLLQKYILLKNTKDALKPVPTISILTSAAIDFDILTTWWFFLCAVERTKVVRELRIILLLICILGTVAWVMLLMNDYLSNKCALKLMRWFPSIYTDRSIVKAHGLLFGIMCGDVPQIALTFYIDGVCVGDVNLRNIAIINFMTSFYSMIIKLTEELDEEGEKDEYSNYDHASKIAPKWINEYRSRKHYVHSLTNMDGKYFLTASQDNSVKQWNIETGKCTHTFCDAHAGWVTCVAKVKGTVPKFVTGSHDRTVKLWNASTRKCERIFEGHSDWVNSVAQLNDSTIITGSSDTTIKMFNLHNGKCMKTFGGNEIDDEGHQDWVTSVSVIPELQNKFISASWDGSAKLWDSSTGKCLRTYNGHTDWVTSVDATIGNGQFITGSEDKTAKLFCIDSGECVRTFVGHLKWIASVANVDGKRFLTGSGDKTVKLWNKLTGDCMCTYDGHTLGVYSLSVVNTGSFLSGSLDETSKLWSIQSSQLLHKDGSLSSSSASSYKWIHTTKQVTNNRVKLSLDRDGSAPKATNDDSSKSSGGGDTHKKPSSLPYQNDSDSAPSLSVGYVSLHSYSTVHSSDSSNQCDLKV